jgi:TonB family protein
MKKNHLLRKNQAGRIMAGSMVLVFLLTLLLAGQGYAQNAKAPDAKVTKAAAPGAVLPPSPPPPPPPPPAPQQQIHFAAVPGSQEKEVFTSVDKAPEFTGGEEARIKYFTESIHYPKTAKEKGEQGKVYVSFIVEADGSISHAYVIKGTGGECDAEALRVISAMPRWIPGENKGEKVRVQFTLPINFSLDHETKVKSK